MCAFVHDDDDYDDDDDHNDDCPLIFIPLILWSFDLHPTHLIVL